jgi:hypothetical protein
MNHAAKGGVTVPVAEEAIVLVAEAIVLVEGGPASIAEIVATVAKAAVLVVGDPLKVRRR